MTTAENPEPHLGPSFRSARTARGLSLRELARQVGMSASSLSEFETGKAQVSDERMAELAAALGVALPPKRVKRPAPPFRHWQEYDELALDPVLEAGLALFRERGYHGSSVRMIAARSGLTVAGVYHHVPSKHDLLLRLMRQAMSEMVARCAGADADAVAPRQRLANLTEAMVAFHVHRLELAHVAANELRSLDQAALDEMTGERNRVLQLFVNAVADCRMMPSPVPDRVAARAIVTMCTAIPSWYDDAGTPDARQLVDQYVALTRDMV